eukprot:1160545-Pelagomonas_calceolata.AAC.29
MKVFQHQVVGIQGSFAPRHALQMPMPSNGYDYNNMVFFRWKVPVTKAWDGHPESCSRGVFCTDCELGGKICQCRSAYARCLRPNLFFGKDCSYCRQVTKVLTFQRAVPLDRDGRLRLSSDYYTWVFARENGECVPDNKPKSLPPPRQGEYEATYNLYDRAGGPGQSARAVGGYTELFNCNSDDNPVEPGDEDDIPGDSDGSDLSDLVPPGSDDSDI